MGRPALQPMTQCACTQMVKAVSVILDHWQRAADATCTVSHVKHVSMCAQRSAVDFQHGHAAC